MSLKQLLHNKLKKVNLIVNANAFYKSIIVKIKYLFYVYKYNSLSIYNNFFLTSFKKKAINVTFKKNSLNIFYVGTNFFQDSSGFLQAISAYSKLTLYKGPNNNNQLLFPKNRSEIEKVREMNSKQLELEIDIIFLEHKIDVLVGQMWNYLVSKSTLERIKEKYKLKIVNICMDDRHSFHLKKLDDGTDGGTYGLIGPVDLFCTAAPECTSWYNYYNAKSIFLPEGSSSKIFTKSSLQKIYDVVFIGANYGFRSQVINFLVKNNINVYCRGIGWPDGQVSVEEMSKIFSQSKIILGIGGILHSKKFNALKLRDFDATMSGSFYLAQYNIDLKLLFEENTELVMWNNLEDLLSKIKYFLLNDNIRESIANKSYERAKKDHEWNYRILEILQNINE